MTVSFTVAWHHYSTPSKTQKKSHFLNFFPFFLPFFQKKFVYIRRRRINLCSFWKLALQVHFIAEQLKKSNWELSGRFASGLPHWLFKRGTQMTEKDTSEITAGNQDKIWPLSNLRYIPKKNLIPVPYKNAGKKRTCPRTGGAFSAPGFSGVQDKKRWDCAAFILPKVCVANFRINCSSRWKLALRVHFITEQLEKSQIGNR